MICSCCIVIFQKAKAIFNVVGKKNYLIVDVLMKLWSGVLNTSAGTNCVACPRAVGVLCCPSFPKNLLCTWYLQDRGFWIWLRNALGERVFMIATNLSCCLSCSPGLAHGYCMVSGLLLEERAGDQVSNVAVELLYQQEHSQSSFVCRFGFYHDTLNKLTSTIQ